MKIIKRIKNKLSSIAIQAQREHVLTVARPIMPYLIEQRPDYVIINNEIYVKCFIIGISANPDVPAYPEKLNPFLITELLSIESEEFRLQISYGLRNIDNSEAIAQFDRAEYFNKLDQISYTTNEKDSVREPPYVKTLQSKAYKKNIESLFDNDESLFRTSLIVVIKAKNLNALTAAHSKVRSTIKGSRVYYSIPETKHLSCLLSAMMYPAITRDFGCELFSYHASLLLPLRSPGSRLSESGVLFGDTIEENPRSVMIDMDKLSAHHVFLCGASGTGKTYFLMLYLMRALTMEKKKIIFISPKADEGTNYINVINFFKGQVIELGRGKSKNINPFQIFFRHDKKQNAADIFYAHVDLLKNFFMALILSETAGRDNMIAYLERTIHQAYYAKGIILDDMTTWHDWPFLSDIYRIWESEKDDDPTANALYNKSSSILTSWNYLNAPSNVDLDNDFIVFDTSGMRSTIDKLQDAFNVLLVAMMGQYFKSDNQKNVIICVDEARIFLQNSHLLSFLMRTLMEGRSSKIELVLACQQPSDLQKSHVAEEFLTNININIILGGMSPANVKIVSDFFSLDTSQKDRLLALGKGQGLILIGSQTIETDFKSTDLEHKIIKGEISDPTEAKKLSTDSYLEFISPEIRSLFLEQKICFEDWLNSDPDLLLSQGFERLKAVDPLTGKNIRVWISQNQTVANQTNDHFVTVCRIAGALIQEKHTITINHYDDADIIVNGKIALEYERPGTHTIDEIIKKRDAALQKYEQIFFICQTQNYELVRKAAGEERTIKRGKELSDLITQKLKSYNP